MDLLRAHALHTTGDEGPVYLFGHGIGGSQDHWREAIELLPGPRRAITFALAGSPGADPGLFDPDRHRSILGFADDLARLCAAARLRDVVYVGHSMSGMAGALAAVADPGLFRAMVLVGASARYIDDPATGYEGGFSGEAVEGLLDAIGADYALWSAGFAPVVMGPQDDPRYANEFARSLASYEPAAALTLFRAAFTSDFRAEMARVRVPTLLLATRADPAVPASAATWLRDAIPGAQLETIDAQGHFAHVVRADAVADAITRFVHDLP